MKGIYVIDLEGNEYPLQATTTKDLELNGNQSLSFKIPLSKVNKQFIHDITELWQVVDHDDIAHKIIYLKKRGEGSTLSIEVKAIPKIFDDLDSQRIYERYDRHMTAQYCFNLIFEGSGYNFVLNGSFEAIQWEGFGEGDTRLALFKKALERYKAEFRIVGNTVYLENLIGRDTQFMYRYRLNASNIVQENDATAYYTYAKGYGDYGDGEGGEDWRDAKLTREYTSPIASIIGKREAPPIKNGNITTSSTMDEQLKILVDESLKISVSADIHDLRKQGYALAQPELGDRVFLIDERIGLDEEVRVIDISILRNWEGEVIDLKLTLGSPGIVKRHQANLQTAISNITQLLDGKLKLPFSVLDNAVAEATKALQSAQTELSFSDNGILAIDKTNPNNVVLFNSSGVGLSTDGGATFGQAMTAEGFNADYMFAGTMLADRIAGGILQSLNGVTDFNLNNGRLRIKHSDGSYTQMDTNGFQRFESRSGSHYHYLFHVTTFVYGESSSSARWIQLPSEFKGKDFKVFFAIADSMNAPSYSYSIQRFVCTVHPDHSIDYKNARIPVIAYKSSTLMDGHEPIIDDVQGLMFAIY